MRDIISLVTFTGIQVYKELLYSLGLRRSKNGKKRLAYGQSPEDALEILSYRLSPEEMDEIIRDDFQKINQRKLQEVVDQLG